MNMIITAKNIECTILFSLFNVSGVGVLPKNDPGGRDTLPAPRNARDFSNFSPFGGGGRPVCDMG